jgi:hypothetical protein
MYRQMEIIKNDKLERIRENAIAGLTYLRYCPSIWRHRGKPRKTSFRIAGDQNWEPTEYEAGLQTRRSPRQVQ